MKNLIPVNRPKFSGNEKKYLNEVIDTGWISSESPFVTRFEKAFSEYFQMKFASTVSNGTVALELAVRALGLKKNDEVILPSFTIISCVLAVIRAGAKPVLVDVDPETWNMDVDLVESKINSNTKAILVVHTYGLPTDMDKINFLKEKYGLYIIEDNAEGIGLKFNNRICGSFGDLSIVSLYSNKHVTTGEGGMVFTNNENIHKNINYWKNLCFNKEARFVHFDLGWNYRLTGLQAAVGLAQLEQIESSISKKKEIARIYDESFRNTESISTPLQSFMNSQNIYWVYGITLNGKDLNYRNKVMKSLLDHGIETRPFFWPIHLQPVLKQQGFFPNEIYPVSERIGSTGLYLPSGIGNTEDEIQYSADTLNLVIGDKNL